MIVAFLSVGYNPNNGSKWMIFIRIGFLWYSVGSSILGSDISCVNNDLFCFFLIVDYNPNNGSKWMIFIRIGFAYYSVGSSILCSNISCVNYNLFCFFYLWGTTPIMVQKVWSLYK